jgi:hypothetical protein
MTVSLKHTFQSAKTDSADATIVQPSNWNQEHVLTAAAGKVLGRDTSGAGNVQELPISVTSAGNVTIPNNFAVTGTTGLTGTTTLVDLTSTGTASLTNLGVTGTTTLTNALTVANGGTGAATLTANNVLIGNGTSAVTSVAPSTAGNVLTSNGTSWTSATASVSGSLNATATGSLSNGSTVVINTDGTVSVVGPTIVATPSAGTSVVLNSNGTNNISTAYDSVNQKVVVAYVDNLNGFGVAKVGTVSGTSISFGSSVTFNAGATGITACAYDTNAQKIVIAYKDDNNGGFGTAIVGTVSGTSISFGSAAVFLASFGIGTTLSVVYDATALKVVIAFIDAGANQGKAVVGTVSGTNISFGTVVQFVASSAGIAAAYDANAQKVVVTYRDGSGFGNALVGTVSGTNISFGTNVVYISANIANNAIVYDANALKVVVAYTNAGFGTAIVGTVSGTNISFGTPVVFRSATTSNISAAYDAGVQRDTFAYVNGTTGFGDVIAGTVSGTSISFSASSTYESLALQNPSASVYNAAAQKIVTSYRVLSGGVGRSVVISPTTSVFNLTTENFIGFSSAAYTNGQTATIQLVGSVNTAQSGLTAGQSYFVLTDGTLSLTAGSPSVFAGTAVAATKIIVKG